MKKVIAFLTMSVMLLTLFAGCTSGGNSSKADSSTASGASESEKVSENSVADTSAENSETADMPYAGKVITIGVSDTQVANEGEVPALIKLVAEKTGIVIEPQIIPEAQQEGANKLMVMLTNGGELDLMYSTTPDLYLFNEAGVVAPLDELAAAAGYDMAAVFGDNLPVIDGQTYGLPAFNDIWTTFYNKQVFDDAGLEYPTAENWTWEKYIETAKALTKGDTFGSYMLDYDNYYYMLATQKGAQPYTADGEANFEDPLYLESLKFFTDLSLSQGIQPKLVNMGSGSAYPWNAFWTRDPADLGMFVCGGWAASSLAAATEKGEKDWSFGMLPLPYPDGEEATSLVVTGNYAIPATSKNADVAFEALRVIAEEIYTLNYGRVPARIDLDEAEIERYISEGMVGKFSADGLTAQEIKDTWFNPEITLVSEKILGTAAPEIRNIWKEYGSMVGMESMTAEEAIAQIQEKANEAIAEAE